MPPVARPFLFNHETRSSYIQNLLVAMTGVKRLNLA